MRPFLLSSVFLWFGCTSSEKSITTTNQLPSAVITSHSDGAQLPEGVTILFTGSVSDTNNQLEDLRVAWYAGTEVLCPEAAPEVDATTRCEGAVDSDVTSITLAVRDPDNARADASISVQVVPTDAPEATIVQPVVDGVYYENEIIAFEGILADTEDVVTDLEAYWMSSIDGVLTSVDAVPNSNGEVVGYGNLSEGQHIIELHVEDTTGKVNKDSLVIEVSAANSAPTCSLTQPTMNSAGAEGAVVTFQGLVVDADVPTNQLSVSWTSDKDGVLGTSVPNASGVVTFPFDGLSLNTHLISMTVTDDVGEQCVADVLYTVGLPPSIVLNEPVIGSLYSEGESILFVAEISDSEDAPVDLNIVWESSVDGTFSTQGAASTGVAQFATNALTFGVHDITVTVTDSLGLYAEALTQVTVNGVPSQPAVSISPSPAYSSDVLLASATGSTDPEGAPVTYIYEWLLNGSFSAHTGASLPNSATNKGEDWTVRATPSDGTANGDFGEATVTIVNSVPVVTSVAISPATPTPQDTLTCMYNTSDADGDTVSPIFQWTMGGNALSSTTDTLNGPFQYGDVISCSVTPYDGTDYGAPVTNTVTVANAAPVVASVTLSPSAVYTNDLLQVNVIAADPDGDPLSYVLDWFVDSGSGFNNVQSTTGATFDSLDGVFQFDKGDSVYAEATVTDGTSTVTQTSSTIVVQNTLPSATNVLITPPNPIAGVDDLECLAQGGDVDGDSVSFGYAWEMNGSITSYTSNIISTNNISTGEVWTCFVTPFDGTDYGVSSSASVTVGSNTLGTTGSGWCASAGAGVDATGNSFATCLSETGVVGEESTDGSSYTLQPGSIFVFSPE